MHCNDRWTAALVAVFLLASVAALVVQQRRADAVDRARVAALPRTSPLVPLP